MVREGNRYDHYWEHYYGGLRGGSICESSMKTPHPDPCEVTASLATEAHTPPGESRSSFCALPRVVRVRIYLHVGVYLGEPPYRLDLAKPEDLANDYRNDRDKPRWSVARRLMLTCKTFHTDVASMIYPSMSPYIDYETAGSFDGLRSLTSVSLRSIKSLTIVLSYIPCSKSFSCGSDQSGYLNAAHKLSSPLCVADEKSKRRIEAWLDFWPELKKWLLPGRLDLTLTCDVADFETALTVVQPFFSCTQDPLPLLADCTIRLGRHKNSALSLLARRAVMAATTGIDVTEEVSSFHFQDLPEELRMHVLSFTDLVLPNEEVEWNPAYGGYYTRHLEDLAEPSWRGVDWCNRASIGCYCRAFHAVYSSNRICCCWGYPIPFFLVSRSFYQEAKRTFFGLNRIIIAPAGGQPWKETEYSNRLAASIFLTNKIPTNDLQHIRSMEIVFPSIPRETTYCPEQSPEWIDWNHALEIVRHKLNLPALTLRVSWPEYVPHNVYSYDEDASPDEWPAFIRREERFDEVIKSYTDTIAPLKKLRGLNRFFAHLSHPRGQMGRYWETQPHRDPQDEMRDTEAQMERLVMGDGYDAAAAGKADAPVSLWKEDAIDWIFAMIRGG